MSRRLSKIYPGKIEIGIFERIFVAFVMIAKSNGNLVLIDWLIGQKFVADDSGLTVKASGSAEQDYA